MPSGKRSWNAISQGFGALTTTTLTAFARCTSGIKSVSLATESATLKAGIASQLQPRCPPTRAAVGGGFKVTPTFHFTPLPIGGPLIVPLESRRIGGRDWRVTAANFNSGAYVVAGRLTAYAVCASGSAAVRTATKSAPIADDKRTAAVAKCPSRWHTVSGGFKASPIFDDPTKSLYILPEFDASAPQGSRAWSTTATISSPFFTATTNGAITAYAYCEHD